MGLTVIPVRKPRASKPARGATDFGEYFVYFSFFLMISALLADRAVLQARQSSSARARSACCARWVFHRQDPAMFLMEGAVLAAAGALRGNWRARWPMANSSCSACAPGGSTPWARGYFRCTPPSRPWPSGAAAGMVTGLGATRLDPARPPTGHAARAAGGRSRSTASGSGGLLIAIFRRPSLALLVLAAAVARNWTRLPASSVRARCC